MSETEASARIGPAARPVSPTISGQFPLLTTICLAPLVGVPIGVALTPFFPAIARDLGTSVALLGQIPAVSMLVAGLGLVVGPLADHSGHRRLLVLGSLAVVVIPAKGPVSPGRA